jgi:hypothetical protein
VPLSKLYANSLSHSIGFMPLFQRRDCRALPERLSIPAAVDLAGAAQNLPLAVRGTGGVAATLLLREAGGAGGAAGMLVALSEAEAGASGLRAALAGRAVGVVATAGAAVLRVTRTGVMSSCSSWSGSLGLARFGVGSAVFAAVAAGVLQLAACRAAGESSVTGDQNLVDLVRVATGVTFTAGVSLLGVPLSASFSVAAGVAVLVVVEEVFGVVLMRLEADS